MLMLKPILDCLGYISFIFWIPSIYRMFCSFKILKTMKFNLKIRWNLTYEECYVINEIFRLYHTDKIEDRDSKKLFVCLSYNYEEDQENEKIKKQKERLFSSLNKQVMHDGCMKLIHKGYIISLSTWDVTELPIYWCLGITNKFFVDFI